VVDSPWKDEDMAIQTVCDLIVPGEEAKPAGEVLQGSQTRPIFVAQLIRVKTK
jgi:hypothetical protein